MRKTSPFLYLWHLLDNIKCILKIKVEYWDGFDFWDRNCKITQRRSNSRSDFVLWNWTVRTILATVKLSHWTRSRQSSCEAWILLVYLYLCSEDVDVFFRNLHRTQVSLVRLSVQAGMQKVASMASMLVLIFSISCADFLSLHSWANFWSMHVQN